MIEADGVEATEAWAEGLVANLARPPQGGDTDQIEAVAAGECDIGVVNHYYFVRLLKSEQDAKIGDQVGIVFPNQDGRGAHANISGAGLVATAPHPENAAKFLEYLTSPQAQIYFAEGNNEFPVVAGDELDPILQSWGVIKTDDVNAAKYGENNPDAVKLMDRAGGKVGPSRNQPSREKAPCSVCTGCWRRLLWSPSAAPPPPPKRSIRPRCWPPTPTSPTPPTRTR
jgi:iron(III) transport system substrate-binding protein